MPRAKRATSPAAKQDRRDAILREALDTWTHTTYAEFTMNRLAERLGLAKGTLYLYFSTKEELFLTLYEQLLSEWFDTLLVELEGRADLSPAELADVLSRTLIDRPQFTRLVPLLEGLLEHNIDEERALAYKTWLLGRAGTVSAAFEASVPTLPRGSGMSVLVLTQALVSGLRQMGSPAPVVVAVLQGDLRPLAVDYAQTLPFAMRALLVGLSRTD
jgi:AcrR family transcriptional regulator